MNLDNAVQDSTESGWYPLTSFAFMLRVELAFDLPCRAIKGLRRENEFDYIQEGGLNDYVHMKRKSISRPFTFQVERYVGLDYLDPLPLGVELVLPVLLFVNPYPFRNSSFFKPVRSYAFLGCTVTAKDYGELNAESSGLLVETTTIAFREMACIDLPSKWLNKNSWNFALDKDGKIDYEGQGDSNKNTRDAGLSDASKRSKKEMEEKAAERLWALDKKVKEGNKKRNYLTNAAKTNTSDTELTADKMNAKAQLWPKKASAVKEKMETPKAELWSFDKDKKVKAGNGTRRYLHKANGTNTPDVEATQEQMNAKATLWAFDKEKKAKSGNGKRSYLHEEKGTNTPGVEATKEQMQKKAQQWAFGKDNKVKAGNGTRNYLHRDKGTNTPDVEKTREQMQKKAQQWAFGKDKKVKAGNGTRNYLHEEGGTNTPGAEATQDQMNKKAQQWAFDKKTKAGNDKRGYLHKDGGTNTPSVEKTREQMQKKASIWPPKESAKKSSSSKAKSRLWPKTSSAQTAQTANIKGAGRT